MLVVLTHAELYRSLERARARRSAKLLKEVGRGGRPKDSPLRGGGEYYGNYRVGSRREARHLESRTRITVRLARKLLNSAPDVSRRARFGSSCRAACEAS